jgi:hypothetical protein
MPKQELVTPEIRLSFSIKSTNAFELSRWPLMDM